ncbi:hypothetical protein Clacol_007438 [Clathrus columnatus]|uniref:F-box domain-containing protein n=1 Tax=Clathrus columnatus TaxID=1419009 RepID=A0AAV5AEY4_9AGAM|nr:hypothetical protein Clacol_007438 [Clathrus columnatus]
MTTLPRFPTEILIIIISYAATGDTDLASRLCQVSRWVRDIVQPILYKVVTLNHTSLSETKKRLQCSHVRNFIRDFGLAGVHGMPDLENYPLQTVRNFATDSIYNLKLVMTENIEELHFLNVVAHRPLVGVTFPRLRRLHYYGRRGPLLLLGSAAISVSRILQDTILTHLAISVPDERGMFNLISDINTILKTHRMLQLLYVRILHSTALVLHGADYESLEGQLAAIGDPRLVVRRIDMIASAEVLLSEWERNARLGGGIWNWAEGQLEQRDFKQRFSYSLKPDN